MVGKVDFRSAVVLPAAKRERDIAGRQFFLGEQAGVYQCLEIQEVTQRVKREVGEKGFRGDISIARARI